MPSKALNKKTVEFVPALTKFKGHLLDLPDNAASINVPLRQIVHLATMSTRPLVKSDVHAKLRLFEDKDGWHGSYNVMSRVLTAVERKELFEDITTMQANPGEASSIEQSSNFRHTMLNIKVKGCTSTRRYTSTHTQTHTHTMTHIHTLQERRTAVLKALNAGEAIYAIIDGAHRVQAMLIRALDSAVECVTLDTRIPVVPHESTVHSHEH
jgi:hypothetical protein